MKRKCKGYFTLIEAMIVIAIIGIFAAIVMPALRGAQVPIAGQGEVARPTPSCH